MRRLLAAVFTMLMLSAAPGVDAQQPAKLSPIKAEFEVASVRNAPPRIQGEALGLRGGPGSSDPERVSFRSESLLNLLLRGFNLLPDPFSGPSWLNSEYYDVAATLPPGTTVDRFKEMLRNLLVQRFGLTFHYMTKDFTVYRIVVGKGGLKMKESPIDPNFPSVREARPPKIVVGLDGFPELPEGRAPAVMTVTRDGVTSESARKQSLVGFPRKLENMIRGGVRVVDKTGLTGTYDYRLRFSRLPNAGDPEPDIFAALEDQLGLKLEQGTEQEEVLVVDHVDRVPEEN